MRKLLLAASFAAIAAVPAVTAQSTACEREQRSDRVAGTVVGGVAGALLGSVIAGNSSNTEGTVIGGVAGAIAGNQIAKSGNPCPPGYRRSWLSPRSTPAPGPTGPRATRPATTPNPDTRRATTPHRATRPNPHSPRLWLRLQQGPSLWHWLQHRPPATRPGKHALRLRDGPGLRLRLNDDYPSYYDDRGAFNRDRFWAGAPNDVYERIAFLEQRVRRGASGTISPREADRVYASLARSAARRRASSATATDASTPATRPTSRIVWTA